MESEPPRDASNVDKDERQASGGGGREALEQEGLLRPAEVLRRTGITHQILYRYVTAGLIEPAVVTGSGQRWFRPEVVALIEIIRDFTQDGYSLRDLKDTYFQDKNVQRLLGRR